MLARHLDSADVPQKPSPTRSGIHGGSQRQGYEKGTRVNLPSSHPRSFTPGLDVVLYSLTVFLITSSFYSSASSSSSLLFGFSFFQLAPAISCSLPYPSLPAHRTNVLIHLHPSCCFLFFFPMSGFHNASGNPTPSSLSVLLSPSRPQTTLRASPLAHPPWVLSEQQLLRHIVRYPIS